MDDEKPFSQPDYDPRVDLAIERATLAWVRTAVGLIGVGFIIARSGLVIRALSHSGVQLTMGGGTISLLLGIAMILVGVLACGAAAERARHHSTFRSFDVALSIAVGLLGIFISVHLFMAH